MGQFDSVRIGVCDCYWTPFSENEIYNDNDEVYLGLTKGGVELTYTPEYHDITVDQYGKTPVDSVLIGESVVTKIPLAETDLEKIKLFSHTATWNADSNKLTFGRFPGFRLGETAGRLRLHPLSNATSSAEDVVIYKAVNKGTLQLNYKLEDETLYNCEFHGMIQRTHKNGAFIFEIGDPDTVLDNLKPDLSNLEDLVKATGGDFTISPSTLNDIYGTADPSANPPKVNTTSVSLSCTYNTVVYDVTNMASYSAQSSVMNGNAVTDGSGNAVSVVTVSNGTITAIDSATLKTYMSNGANLADGDVITTAVNVRWASRSHIVTIKVVV